MPWLSKVLFYQPEAPKDVAWVGGIAQWQRVCLAFTKPWVCFPQKSIENTWGEFCSGFFSVVVVFFVCLFVCQAKPIPD